MLSRLLLGQEELKGMDWEGVFTRGLFESSALAGGIFDSL